MKIRFIEYQNDIYIVLGITYDSRFTYPDCFVVVPLDKHNPSIFKTIFDSHTLLVPFIEAKEITDKNRIISLMVLYG